MISQFIERARRRFLWNELIAQSAFAAAVLFAGVILLLLAGTQLLDWRWLLALGLAAVAFAAYRTVKRVPGQYQVAVMVDHRAGLHDALSTALHFGQGGAKSAGLPAIREFQKQQAERLIPSVNLDTAVPFRIPRALYVMGLLGLVASGLFALRYGIRRSLDLQAPLSQIVMDGLGFRSPEDKLASAKKKSGDSKSGETFDEQGVRLPRSDQKKAGDLDAAPASALETVGEPDVNNEGAQSAGSKQATEKGEGGGKEGGDKGSPEQSENGQQTPGKSAADSPAGSKEGGQQGEPGASQQSSQGNNSSLLSKVKDAMQNLLSKAKPQPGSSPGQKPNGAQGQQKGQPQQAKSGEKGSPGESKDGGQQDQSEGEGQQAGDQDNADSSQGKGNGKSSEQQAAAQPGSGVGKQDGLKAIRAAEQKAAMGKLSEVIGKRSAQVSGEMMIESQSGPQQLKTQYSRRSASHSQAGGEVNRDEVPVELQGYVQQYFEEVRKGERSGAGARKPAKSAGAPVPATAEPK